MAQNIKQVKKTRRVICVPNKKRSLMLLILFVFCLGFALCSAIFGANFISSDKSRRAEVEMLEQKLASLEEVNDKIGGILKEINETLCEISANIELSSAAADEAETEFLLPNLDTSFKSYMDYRTITCTSSDQYALQQQAYTDELGLRKIGGFYCVALGTYFSSQCGDKFKIYTDNGNKFYVIVADIKDDRHTDESNMYVPLSNGNANVVEFVVDTSAMSSRVAMLGDISGYEQFSGNIIKIERI